MAVEIGEGFVKDNKVESPSVAKTQPLSSQLPTHPKLPTVEVFLLTSTGRFKLNASRIGLLAIHQGVGTKNSLWMVTSIMSGVGILFFPGREDAISAAKVLNHRVGSVLKDTCNARQRRDMPRRIREWIIRCNQEKHFLDPPS